MSTTYTTTRVFPIPPKDNKKPHMTPTQVSPMPHIVIVAIPVKPKPVHNKKGKETEAPSASSSKTPQPCILRETIGNPTDKFPKLKTLKYLLHSPQKPVNYLTSIEKKNLPMHYKALRTNHACDICTEYGNYTYSCPKEP